MGILNDLLRRVKGVEDGLQTGEIVRDVVVQHPIDIMELQKVQLLEGKASSGEDIRPYYSEDLKPGGYFRSVDAAKRYADWKASGISYPYSAKRNPDAPNLYVNGKFHEELDVQFGTQDVGIVATTAYAKQIMDKYGAHTFGLMPENWSRVFVERGGYNELMSEIKTMIYGK